jgi:hypothetical protein
MSENENVEVGAGSVTQMSDYDMKKELKHQSYVELKKDIGALTNIVGEQKRLIQSAHVLLKNYLARQEAVVEILTEKGVCTESELSGLVDKNLGLRERTLTEELQVGDVAWVNYVATITGTSERHSDTQLPIRVGSQTVVFDTALVGRKIIDGKFELKFPLTKGEHAGKEVVYEIDIVKAKVKVGSGEQADEPKAESPN